MMITQGSPCNSELIRNSAYVIVKDNNKSRDVECVKILLSPTETSVDSPNWLVCAFTAMTIE